MSLGKDDEQTTVQNTEPWKPAQNSLKSLLNQGSRLYQQGSEYAPFSTVVPFSGQSEDALQRIEGRASGGNPLYGDSMSTLEDLMKGGGPLSHLTDTAAGNFLDITKSPVWGSLTGGIQDAVNSQFSAHGRTGSPAHAGVMTSELGKLAGSLYGQERNRQFDASRMLGDFAGGAVDAVPGLWESGYGDLERIGQVGRTREAKAGETLQDLMSRWNFGQEQPWANLARWSGLVNPIAGQGGTATSTTTMPDNTLGELLGVGASIAGMAMGNPFAALGAAGTAGKTAGSAMAKLAF